MSLSHHELDETFRLQRDDQEEALRIRIHRAISWLGRAEKETDDLDARFIFLWISLNAVYAQEFGGESKQVEQVRTFITSLLTVDEKRRLHTLLLQNYSGAIRNVLQDKYMFEKFWESGRRHDSSDAWKASFAASSKDAMDAVLANRTVDVFCHVYQRLYVMRNQLIHGGATYGSKVNRDQLVNALQVMEKLVPLVIELMIPVKENIFGELAYPVLKDAAK